LLDQADDRIQGELFLTGLDDPELTPMQRSETILQIEQRNGLTDGELAEIVEIVPKGTNGLSEGLTDAETADTVIQKSGVYTGAPNNILETGYSEGMVLRITEKGYQEEQVRTVIEEMLLWNIDVENVADHVLERLIDRNVTAKDINDAVQEPLHKSTIKYDDTGKPSWEMIGRTVTVVQNPETGKLITVYRTSSKLVERLIKGNGYENKLPQSLS